jgi:hypothetical protein
MSVRAKMYVTSIEPAWEGAPEESKKVKLYCQYDPELSEDQRFCKATPSGSAEYLIDNPAAVAQFKVGQAYYVDFTPVES